MRGPYHDEETVTAALRRCRIERQLEAALARYDDGKVEIPPRSAVDQRPDGSVTHVMTARDVPERLVLTKVVDYDPTRPRRDGRAASAGVLALLRDGEPLLVSPADRFTGIRTGLTAAFAIDRLAAAGPLRVVVLGLGLVGSETLRALTGLRDVTDVRVVGRDRARVARTAGSLSEELGVDIEVAETVRAAGEDAEVLITATSTVTPLVDAADLDPSIGLVAALGAGIAERRELTAAAVHSCEEVFVDTLEGAEVEAGDLVQARGEGVEIRVRSLAAATPASASTGRRLYKSVGSPWQDLACARAVLDELTPGWERTAVDDRSTA